MIGDIYFLSKSKACRFKPSSPAYCISINNSQSESANLTRRYYEGILKLHFDDATEDSCGHCVGDIPDALPGDRKIILNGDQLPDIHDAKKIQAFCQRIADLPDVFTLVIHCEAGISRSAAVAQFAADRFGGTIKTTERLTDGANRRLLRLLNKVANQSSLDVHEIMVEGHLNFYKPKMVSR